MCGLLVAIGAIALGVALASHNPADPSFNTSTHGPTTNLAGPAGAIVSDVMLQCFGFAAALPCLALLAWAFRLATHRGLGSVTARLLGLLAGLPLAAAALSLLPLPQGLPGGSRAGWHCRAGDDGAAGGWPCQPAGAARHAGRPGRRDGGRRRHRLHRLRADRGRMARRRSCRGRRRPGCRRRRAQRGGKPAPPRPWPLRGGTGGGRTRAAAPPRPRPVRAHGRPLPHHGARRRRAAEARTHHHLARCHAARGR